MSLVDSTISNSTSIIDIEHSVDFDQCNIVELYFNKEEKKEIF